MQATPPAGVAIGIACVVGSMATLAVHDATAKFLLAVLTPVMLMWCRYLFQAVATTALMLGQPGRGLFRSRQRGLQALRGALVVGSSMLAFQAIQRMPLAEFTAICCLVPLVVTVLARVVLKEPVSGLRWALVAGGLGGALMVVRPGGAVDGLGAALALGVVLAYATFQILTGVLARQDAPLTTQFHTSWLAVAVLTPLVPAVWTTNALSPSHWGLLLLLGVAGTLGQLLMVQGFSRAPASTLSPYLYSAIAFASLAGWVVFGQVPDALALTGMLLIAVCGIAAGWLAGRPARTG